MTWLVIERLEARNSLYPIEQHENLTVKTLSNCTRIKEKIHVNQTLSQMNIFRMYTDLHTKQICGFIDIRYINISIFCFLIEWFTRFSTRKTRSNQAVE